MFKVPFFQHAANKTYDPSRQGAQIARFSRHPKDDADTHEAQPKSGNVSGILCLLIPAQRRRGRPSL